MTADRIVTVDLDQWRPEQADGALADELERGKVLYFPHLRFGLDDAEAALLDPALVDPRRKNISLNTRGVLAGVADQTRRDAAHALVQRYRDTSHAFLRGLLPAYAGHLHSPTTSLRLHRIGSWRPSWRKDDSLLHVDAFPSRPTGQQRILRVFSNINPHGAARAWRVGEAFDTLTARFRPALSPYRPSLAWLLHRLGITKSRRSEYDHLMLQLHDRMKSDDDYQRQGPQQSMDFPSGSSWVCFSDQTPHAAMTGQFMLEQTFLLPVSAMVHPEQSPQCILRPSPRAWGGGPAPRPSHARRPPRRREDKP